MPAEVENCLSKRGQVIFDEPFPIVVSDIQILVIRAQAMQEQMVSSDYSNESLERPAV